MEAARNKRSRITIPINLLTTLGIMKLVIDSNQLQTEQLREFLGKSPHNIAVLPDFAAMEAYKGDPLKSIFKSMTILSEFPMQVIILKDSAKVCGLNGRTKGLQNRLIDKSQTKGFPEYIRALHLAEAGDKHLQAQIRSHGQYANEHLDKMLSEAENIRSTIEVLGKSYTKEERALLRSKEQYTPTLINKLVSAVLEMATMIFKDTPLLRKAPIYAELPNTFIFRVTFACYLLGLRRFANGGIIELRPDKLRNDFVDMMFVAYGTYFDGLMSSDKNVIYMFEETRLLLSALFDAEVPSLAQLQK